MPNMGDSNFDSLYVLMKGEPGLRKSTQALSFPDLNTGSHGIGR